MFGVSAVQCVETSAESNGTSTAGSQETKASPSERASKKIEKRSSIESVKSEPVTDSSDDSNSRKKRKMLEMNIPPPGKVALPREEVHAYPRALVSFSDSIF